MIPPPLKKVSVTSFAPETLWKETWWLDSSANMDLNEREWFVFWCPWPHREKKCYNCARYWHHGVNNKLRGRKFGLAGEKAAGEKAADGIFTQTLGGGVISNLPKPVRGGGGRPLWNKGIVHKYAKKAKILGTPTLGHYDVIGIWCDWDVTGDLLAPTKEVQSVTLKKHVTHWGWWLASA